jgi:hypothetical protein
MDSDSSLWGMVRGTTDAFKVPSEFKDVYDFTRHVEVMHEIPYSESATFLKV